MAKPAEAPHTLFLMFVYCKKETKQDSFLYPVNHSLYYISIRSSVFFSLFNCLINKKLQQLRLDRGVHGFLNPFLQMCSVTERPQLCLLAVAQVILAALAALPWYGFNANLKMRSPMSAIAEGLIMGVSTGTEHVDAPFDALDFDRLLVINLGSAEVLVIFPMYQSIRILFNELELFLQLCFALLFLAFLFSRQWN